jgi:archaeal flagellar protein FlaI
MTEKVKNYSRAKQMAMILKSRHNSKKPDLASVEKEPDKKPEKNKTEKFQLKGYLYKKFFKKEKKEKYHGRAGKTLGLMKTSQGFPKFEIYPIKTLSNAAPIENLNAKPSIYPLIKPYSYARIKVSEEGSVVYDVVEPTLNKYEEHVYEKLKDGLIQVVNVSFEDIKKHKKMMDFIEENIQKLIEEYDYRLDNKEYLKIMYYVFRDFIGLNKIESLLHDPYIEDIGVDGVGLPVFIVHKKYGSIRTNLIYENEEELKDFVTKLAERCDRYISYAEPLLDGSLPDGTRVNASIASDVTTRGPTFSIRKFREVPYTPVDMVKLNTASPEMLAYLWYTVESGMNILIAGGVATGKTSILNTLSLFIPQESKIVSIEDTREISLPHDNWIPGVTRVGFTGTKVGEVSMFELLRESFRQNPDYLIVGEIRGKEAYIMFQAMASGHPSISTMHAGSVDDVMKRLRTKPISLSPGLLEALDVVIVMIHAMGKGKSARRVKEIVEIESVDKDTGSPRSSKAFTWIPSVDEYEYIGNSWVLSKIGSQKGIPVNDIIKEVANRKKFIEWLLEHNVTDMQKTVEYIKQYYMTPEKFR